MTRPKNRGGSSPAGDDVLALANEALEKLDAALRRSHDLPEAEQKKAASTALVAVRAHLRNGLPQLRASLSVTHAHGTRGVRGSGG